jgi:hypothetical protein
MCQKINGLSENGENSAKTYMIDTKAVNSFLVARQRKRRGTKMKDRAIMLLKKNVEKMSIYGLAIMLMKIS